MPRSHCRLLMLASLTAALLASCTPDDSGARARALASPASRRLVGVWVITFDLDPTRTLGDRSHGARQVTGTLAFAEDHFGRVSAGGIGESTHEGIYDVSFEPLGFSSRAESDLPVAVARIDSRAGVDSLYVVLSPGTARLPVKMTGTLVGDSASGTWDASAFSAGGGAGAFHMRRRAEAP